MKRQTVYAAFISALLAGCSGASTADTARSNAVDAAANTPSGLAIRTVAERIGASPEQITIISEQAVQFSDASLGCPQPGMSYAQVITPGHKVLLEYAGTRYDVRVAGQRGIICKGADSTQNMR